MSNTNGHAPPPAEEPKVPPVAFEYRRDDGRLEVCRMIPDDKGLHLVDRTWWLSGIELGVYQPRVYRLSSIVMFFGQPDTSPKSAVHCLCGAIDRADCSCEAAGVGREGKP